MKTAIETENPKQQSDDGHFHRGYSHWQTAFHEPKFMNSSVMMVVSPQSIARKPALYSNEQQSDDGQLHSGDSHHQTAVYETENH